MIYEHMGITVTNLDRSVEFYTKVFGLKILKRTPINAYLYKDTDMIELIQGKAPTEIESHPNTTDLKELMTCKIGLVHIGFRVDDMGKVLDRFQKLRKDIGGELVVPPVKFQQKLDKVADVSEEKLRRVITPLEWRIAIISDPDGIFIELQER